MIDTMKSPVILGFLAFQGEVEPKICLAKGFLHTLLLKSMHRGGAF